MGLCSSSPKSVQGGEKTIATRKSASDSYEIMKVLGHGASCKVVLAKDRKTKKKYAMKILDKPDKAKEAKESMYLWSNEVRILSSLKHPNILEYVESFEDKDTLNLVTSYCAGGELFDKVTESEFSELDAAKLVKCMLLALKHCHENSIVHRDLKPENFVFEHKGTLADMKLIDFGCALKVKDEDVVKDVAGSPYYVAPEVLIPPYKRTGSTWKASDMWSIGVMIYLLVHGYPPFNGDKQEQIFHRIKKGRFKFNKDLKLSDEVKDLIHKLLVQSPSKRLTAAEALEHAWFKKASTTPLPKKVAKNIKNFRIQCALKKAVGKALVNKMTQKDKDMLAEVFTKYDTNGDGHLDAGELAAMMKDIGSQPDEAKALLDTFDDDKSGGLDLDEFKGAHGAAMLASDRVMADVFKSIDSDGDGVVTVDELEKVLKLGKDEITEMVREVDKDGNGELSLEEWIQAMKKARK